VGSGDNAWANGVTVLCPHLNGSKKNGNNKKSETGTLLHNFSRRLTG